MIACHTIITVLRDSSNKIDDTSKPFHRTSHVIFPMSDNKTQSFPVIFAVSQCFFFFLFSEHVDDWAIETLNCNFRSAAEPRFHANESQFAFVTMPVYPLIHRL